ncbi:MAG: hypothetical protein HQL12_04945 [Candidatus Omnitrophica bacterium]|nr:hypothetical protein [Candidatus Omnitrophota bacterium]
MEYILLVTAVVGVVIAFVASGNSPFQTQLNGTLNTVTQTMNTMANVFASSH